MVAFSINLSNGDIALLAMASWMGYKIISLIYTWLYNMYYTTYRVVSNTISRIDNIGNSVNRLSDQISYMAGAQGDMTRQLKFSNYQYLLNKILPIFVSFVGNVYNGII